MNENSERLLNSLNYMRAAALGLNAGDVHEVFGAFVDYLHDRDNGLYIYLNDDKEPYTLNYQGSLVACIYTSSEQMFESYLDSKELDFRNDSAYEIFRFILAHKDIEGFIINDHVQPWAYMSRDIMEMVVKAVDEKERGQI